MDKIWFRRMSIVFVILAVATIVIGIWKGVWLFSVMSIIPIAGAVGLWFYDEVTGIPWKEKQAK